MPERPCLGKTDLFFSDTQWKIAAAKRLCATCPERDECQVRGESEAFGVWGQTASVDRGFKPGRYANPWGQTRSNADVVLDKILENPDEEYTTASLVGAVPLTRSTISKALNKLHADQFLDRTPIDHQRASFRLRQDALV